MLSEIHKAILASRKRQRIRRSVKMAKAMTYKYGVCRFRSVRGTHRFSRRVERFRKKEGLGPIW